MWKETCQSEVLQARNRSITGRVSLGIQVMVFLMLKMCCVTTATTLVPLSFKDIVAKAEQVVYGEITDVQSEITLDGKKIYTFVTLESIETISGNTIENGTLTLRLSGGHVGDNYSIYAGMPEFKVGERVILFIHLNENAMCPIVGWTQGYFQVVGKGPSEAIKDYSHNPIVGVDSMGNLHRADASGPSRAKSLSSPGISTDGGDPGKLVINAYNTQPALSLSDFTAQIKSIRAQTGFQPEVLAKVPNQWIPVPVDPNQGTQRLWSLDLNEVLKQFWDVDPNNVLQQLWDIDPNNVVKQHTEQEAFQRTPDRQEAGVPRPLQNKELSPEKGGN